MAAHKGVKDIVGKLERANYDSDSGDPCTALLKNQDVLAAVQIFKTTLLAKLLRSIRQL
jgi:hypothetical protein